MKGSHQQSGTTLRLNGQVSNQKHFIFTFARNKAYTLSILETEMVRPHTKCHVIAGFCYNMTTVQSVDIRLAWLAPEVG